MNSFMIVILIILGLLFVIIIILAAEFDKRNIKRRKKRVSLLTKYYPWRRNDDQLLIPLDQSDIESTLPSPDSYPYYKQAFDLLYQSKELEDLLSYKPSSTRLVVWSILWMSLGLVFFALAIFGPFESNAVFGISLIGAFPLISGVCKLLKYCDTTLKRLPAIVVYKSKEVYPGHQTFGSAGAVLLVCIKTRDGSMKYYCVNLKLFLKIEQEDIGIAYIRGEHTLDFKKVTLKKAWVV